MGRAYEVRKASIQKTGAMKAKLYSTYAKEIYLVAKGNPDIDSNVNLKRIVEKAKKSQVPMDIIERAIKKAQGNDGTNYETIYYEGFGPGGSTVIIKTLTDNVNRTISYIKEAFNKTKSKMGVNGSVSFNYDHLAIIAIPNENNELIFESLLNEGIEIIDFETENDEIIITMKPTDVHRVKDVLEDIIPNIEYLIDEVGMYPREKVILSNEDKITFDRLINLLADVDDVSEVYHNVE